MKTAKEVEGRSCPKCGSVAEQIMFGRNLKGIQRFRCKKCGKIYTMEKPQPLYPDEVKEQAIKAYYSGLSARQVGRLFHMNKANVLNWIKKAEGKQPAFEADDGISREERRHGEEKSEPRRS